MKPLEFHPAAETELREAVTYYNMKVDGLGADLTSKVRVAAEEIRRHPEAWPIVRPNVRRKRVPRFPYGLVYQEFEDKIVVLAVMHLNRKPDYWTDRF